MRIRFTFLYLILSICFLLSILTEAHAQSARVVKTQGQRAIVEFPPGTRPQVGQTLDVGRQKRSNSAKSESREHLIGGAVDISFLSNSRTEKSVTTFGVAGRFGWNVDVFEFGPTATLIMSTAEDVTSRALAVGGFFDFNFEPNLPSTELLYGLGAETRFGQTTMTTMSLENSSTHLMLQGGPFVKWFPFGNSVAVRGDAVLFRQSYSGRPAEYAETGLKFLGGLSVYF